MYHTYENEAKISYGKQVKIRKNTVVPELTNFMELSPS
jgi:hypothetical protein